MSQSNGLPTLPPRPQTQPRNSQFGGRQQRAPREHTVEGTIIALKNRLATLREDIAGRQEAAKVRGFYTVFDRTEVPFDKQKIAALTLELQKLEHAQIEAIVSKLPEAMREEARAALLAAEAATPESAGDAAANDTPPADDPFEDDDES